MKRHLLLCLFSLLGFTSFAQDESEYFKKDEVSGDYYHEEVVEMAGLKKEEMFERAKKWVIANFKTADNNIKFDDKEFNIVNSAAIKIDKKMFTGVNIKDGAYDFKFQVWFKDGKYKVRVDNLMFYIIVERSGGFAEKGDKNETYSYADLKDNKWGNYLKKQASEKTASVLSVFNNAVKSESAPTNKNDW